MGGQGEVVPPGESTGESGCEAAFEMDMEFRLGHVGNESFEVVIILGGHSALVCFSRLFLECVVDTVVARVFGFLGVR